MSSPDSEPSPTPSPTMSPAPKPTRLKPMTSAATGDTWFRSSPSPRVPAASRWKYKFDEMLGKSYFFYEINRAGRLPTNSRVPWRGDTLKAKNGGSKDGIHEGGYFDAGDHNIFMLPQGYAIGRLCWLLHEFPDGLRYTYFDGSSNRKWAREACKWGADFLVRGIKSDNEYLLHIGSVREDHAYLGRAENYPEITRNIRYCKSGTCSDVTGEAAAALAHASLGFSTNERLSQRYWDAAEKIYAMTSADRAQRASDFGNSNDAYDLLRTYYPSSGVATHVFWAAASMWTVCKARGCPNEAKYLAEALKIGVMKEADGGQKWYWEVPGWDNAWWDGAILMARGGYEGKPIYGGQKGAFVEFPQSFAEKWVKGLFPIQVSPEGQRFALEWGSNRFAAAGAATLLIWSKFPQSARPTARVTPQEARCAALKQLHYIAGDNSKGSFVVGFGENSPKRPHHRNAACHPAEQAEDSQNHCKKYFMDMANPRGECDFVVFPDNLGRCYLTANRKNKFTVHGALIGGPKTPTDAGDPNRIAYSKEGWNDWRTDWVASEVTVDYNAMYTMALAGASELDNAFWDAGCSGKNDLQLGTPAGLSRKSPSPPADGLTFEDFAEWGWTRTGKKFMGVIP